MRKSDLWRQLREIGDSKLAVDFGLIGLIIGVLIAMQLVVPPTIRTELAFNHQEFAPWTLLAGAYVHAGTTHLLQNVAGFLFAAVVAYSLIRDINARQWFHVTTVVMLTVLPILVSLTSYGLITWLVPQATPVERGFSGVASGFVGFVFATFVVWIKERSSLPVARYIGQAVFVILVGEVALIYSGVDALLLGLVGVGVALTGWGLSWERRTLEEWWHDSREDALIGCVVVGALLMFMLMLFPANFVGGGEAVNVFAHGGGFLWGIVVSLVGYRNIRT